MSEERNEKQTGENKIGTTPKGRHLRARRCLGLLLTAVVLVGLLSGFWLAVSPPKETLQEGMSLSELTTLRNRVIEISISSGWIPQRILWKTFWPSEVALMLAICWTATVAIPIILSIAFPRPRVLLWLAVIMLVLWFLVGFGFARVVWLQETGPVVHAEDPPLPPLP